MKLVLDRHTMFRNKLPPEGSRQCPNVDGPGFLLWKFERIEPIIRMGILGAIVHPDEFMRPPYMLLRWRQ